MEHTKNNNFPSWIQSRLAGFHDGRRITLIADSLSQPDLAVHESVHDMLIATTTDGLLLSILLELSHSEATPNLTRKKCSNEFAHVVDRTRFAHEVFATYLGIQVMVDSSRARAIQELDPEYLNYYQFCEKLMPTRSTSTYLNSMIGLELAVLAFSSNVVMKLTPEWLNSEETDIYREGWDPSERTRELAAIVTRQEFQKEFGVKLSEAKQLATDGGCPEWDIESEQGWLDNIAHAREMELCISNTLRPWLASIFPAKTVTEDNQMQVCKKVIDDIRSEYEGVLQETKGVVLEAIEAGSRDERLGECSRQGGSRIMNESAADFAFRAPVMAANEVDSVQRKFHSVSLCRSHNRECDRWYVVGGRGDQKAYAVGAVEKSYLLEAKATRASWIGNTLGSMIYPLSCFSTESEFSIDFILDESVDVFTYVDQHWFGFINKVSIDGVSARYGLITSENFFKSNSGGVTDTPGVDIHVLGIDHEAFPVFIKIFNHVASKSVFLLMSKLMNRGSVGQLRKDELIKIEGAMDLPLAGVRSFWEWY